MSTAAKRKRPVQQSLPFPKGKPLAQRSPCEGNNLLPEQWANAGFPRNFDQHRYCEKVYVGWFDEQGQLHRCECLCHVR